METIKNTDILENVSNICKIGISGGPAAGKSTILDLLKSTYKDATDIHAFFLVESATELAQIGFGMPPKIDEDFFEEMLFDWQITKEDYFTSLISQNYSDMPTVLFLDRTALDVFAYTTEKAKDAIFKTHGISDMDDIIRRYDAVIHLESSAALAHYRNENNTFRRETSKTQARKSDARVKALNDKHPSYYFISATNDIADKFITIKSVIDKILHDKFD